MKESPGYPYVFDSKACQLCPGNCCCGDSGKVWVSATEIEQISTYLGTNIIDCIAQYFLFAEGRYTCRERVGRQGMECVFFQDAPLRCAIYPVRPSGCRSYPFWRNFLENPERVMGECPGVRLKVK